MDMPERSVLSVFLCWILLTHANCRHGTVLPFMPLHIFSLLNHPVLVANYKGKQPVMMPIYIGSLLNQLHRHTRQGQGTREQARPPRNLYTLFLSSLSGLPHALYPLFLGVPHETYTCAHPQSWGDAIPQVLVTYTKEGKSLTNSLNLQICKFMLSKHKEL